jgi:hypothetical protein
MIGRCLLYSFMTRRHSLVASYPLAHHGPSTITHSTGFQSLPAVLFTDTQLERLNLEGNPIARRQLVEFDGVEKWLERQSQTKQKDLALYMGP